MTPRPPARGPADALRSPRFSGLRTFARLPTLEQVEHCDVAVLGAPFDAAASYRVGARFGPAAVRDASVLLRPHHPALEVDVFSGHQIADAGDAAPDPLDIGQGHRAIHARALELAATGARVLGIGGDHSVALPLMRAAAECHGALSLVQFDAHSDTWDEYFGHRVSHGTIMRRAAEEGIVDARRSTQIGIRGPLYSSTDLDAARDLGFEVVTTEEAVAEGAAVAQRALERIDGPVYVSVDVDVLDPAFAPGTGTPEPGGLQTRELWQLLRALRPAGATLAGADVVEVSPPYDHAGLTAAAGAQAAYELLALMAPATS